MKMNVLMCGHSDYNWIGGIKAELHEKQPELKMVRRGLFKQSKRLVAGPKSNL